MPTRTFKWKKDSKRQGAIHNRPDEHGQAVVIVALALVGLLAMSGLVFDGGNAYVQRRKMQNAADGASFAGAKLLAMTSDSSAVTECAIRVAVETYAKANGVPGPNPDPTCNALNTNLKAYFVNSSGSQVGVEIGLNSGVPSGARGVRVIPQTTFNTFFLGVVNQSFGAVNAQAAAIYGNVKSVNGPAPLAIQCASQNLNSCFTPGNPYDLFEGSGPGNFGWLSWNGDNNAGYVADELNPALNTISGYDDPIGSCPELNAGCWVQGAPGNKNSNDIRNQLDAWIQRGIDSGTPMMIPIWDTAQADHGHGGGSNWDYHVIGFAAFIIEDYNLPPGQGSTVTGRFVKFVTPADFCISGCIDSGLKTTILSQ